MKPWVEVARELGPELAAYAARHDVEGSFVDEAYQLFRTHRLFSMAVPAELGGGGATHHQTCGAIRELGRHCGSSALALSMHTHLVAAAVWRHRHGQPGEKLLRAVAERELILVSTGATDWVDSNGAMERVDGGYRVTARKVFGSGGPAADLMIASAPYDDPTEGPLVLHFSVPFEAEGVMVAGDWNTLAMRGTGSHSIVLDRVFVPDRAITLRRARGHWHPSWNVVLGVAVPIYMSAYAGVVDAAAALARREAAGKPGVEFMPYLAGELENDLAIVELAWRDMIAITAEYELAPTLEVANAQLVRKTVMTQAALRAVEKAAEICGGRGFFRSFGLERLLRDVHAAPFHPLPEKRQLQFTGRIAMGLDPITAQPLVA
jgi:alkylation response protein AidB-like acyl-CoA dehydrogenase